MRRCRLPPWRLLAWLLRLWLVVLRSVDARGSAQPVVGVDPWVVVVGRDGARFAACHRVEEQHELGFRDGLALLVPSLQSLELLLELRCARRRGIRTRRRHATRVVRSWFCSTSLVTSVRRSSLRPSASNSRAT